MSEDQDALPAFPQKEPLASDCHGMTLRDYFAAKAMASFVGGAMARNMVDEVRTAAKMKGQETSQFIAVSAYEQADAMLKARQA